MYLKVYNVTDYAPLHPKICYPAAAYDPARKKLVDRPSTIEDVIDFVVDFMDSDVCIHKILILMNCSQR